MGTDDAEKAFELQVKALLVDGATRRVVWMNRSAARDALEALDEGSLKAESAVPLATQLGLGGALERAISEGTAQHCRVRLVSTGRGSLEIVAAVYPLPDQKLLLLVENTWQPGNKAEEGASVSRSRGRRARP